MACPLQDEVTSLTAIGGMLITALRLHHTLERGLHRRKAIAGRTMRRWRNFAALIGGRFTDSCEAKRLQSGGSAGSTQGFFALLLERRDLDVVRREKGRLRSYLLVSLKNFLAKARRRELDSETRRGPSVGSAG